MAYILEFLGRDKFGRALYRDETTNQEFVNICDVSSILEHPQYEKPITLCSVTIEGEPDIPYFVFGDKELSALDTERINHDFKVMFRIDEHTFWKPYINFYNFHNGGISPDEFIVCCTGGYPMIASLRFKTNHDDGNECGWDLADFAFIVDGKPKWGKDASLLTYSQRKRIEKICEKYKNK